MFVQGFNAKMIEQGLKSSTGHTYQFFGWCMTMRVGEGGLFMIHSETHSGLGHVLGAKVRCVYPT